MKVAVEMSSEEFQEFLEWRKDQKLYATRERATWQKLELFAKKIDWAVEPDPKKEGKYKITDHDHMDELYLMAGELLADV